MAGFGVFTAFENIVAAWDCVTAQFIENFFHIAGFICSIPTVPEPEEEPEKMSWTTFSRF